MVSTRDDGSYYIGVWRRPDEPACTHDLARAFASRISKVCKLMKTQNKFKTFSLSGHGGMSDYKTGAFSDMR